MKPVRCPGPTPDVSAKSAPGCGRITAEPVNGQLKYTADAAGPEHGFRCFEHTRDREAPRPVSTGSPTPRPQRPHPTPAEQARAREDMARYLDRVAHDAVINQRASAANAAEIAARRTR